MLTNFIVNPNSDSAMMAALEFYFVIERKAVDDPDKELSKWVVDSFGKNPQAVE